MGHSPRIFVYANSIYAHSHTHTHACKSIFVYIYRYVEKCICKKRKKIFVKIDAVGALWHVAVAGADFRQLEAGAWLWKPWQGVATALSTSCSHWQGELPDCPLWQSDPATKSNNLSLEFFWHCTWCRIRCIVEFCQCVKFLCWEHVSLQFLVGLKVREMELERSVFLEVQTKSEDTTLQPQQVHFVSIHNYLRWPAGRTKGSSCQTTTSRGECGENKIALRFHCEDRASSHAQEDKAREIESALNSHREQWREADSFNEHSPMSHQAVSQEATVPHILSPGSKQRNAATATNLVQIQSQTTFLIAPSWGVPQWQQLTTNISRLRGTVVTFLRLKSLEFKQLDTAILQIFTTVYSSHLTDCREAGRGAGNWSPSSSS